MAHIMCSACRASSRHLDVELCVLCDRPICELCKEAHDESHSEDDRELLASMKDVEDPGPDGTDELDGDHWETEGL